MNVDLVEALRNIVKLKVDSYQFDVIKDIVDLNKPYINDYFCFMTRNSGTWLFGQKEVYIKDSQANTTWKHYKDSDVTTYAIEITLRDNDKIRGNIYEVDYHKTLEDVLKNEQVIDRIEVVFSNDNKAVFDIEYFNKNKNDLINEYGEIKKTTTLIKDFFSFNLHQKKIISQRMKKAEYIDLDTYTKDLNEAKLSKLGYTKGDMYYISKSDCKKVLNENKINVYMIRNNERIKIDRPVSDSDSPIYAIWYEDKNRFDSFDRKELNLSVKNVILDKIKEEKLKKIGYHHKDLYLIDNFEVKVALKYDMDIYSIDKDFNKIKLNNLKEISLNIKEGNLIAVDYNDKDKISKGYTEYNEPEYIDILNENEVKSLINVQIKEGTYFNRIEEGQGQYLINNIDVIAEDLIKNYSGESNIAEKIDYIILDKLKNRENNNLSDKKEMTLKERMENAKERSQIINKYENTKESELER